MWSVHTCLLKKNPHIYKRNDTTEDTNSSGRLSLAFVSVSVSLASLHFMMLALIMISKKKRLRVQSPTQFIEMKFLTHREKI